MLVGSQLLRLGFVPLGATIFFIGQRSISSPATMLKMFLILLGIGSIVSALLSIKSAIELLKALPN